MIPAEIILAAEVDGVIVTLSTARTIKASGDQSAVNRWRPTLIEHKAEIINLLKSKPGGSAAPPRPAIPEWCNPCCECFHRLELPALEVVQGCYREIDSTNWRWSRIDKMKSCPRARRH